MQASTGYVGINTTTPAYTLDVNGSARVTSLTVGNLILNSSGTLSGNTTYYFGGGYQVPTQICCFMNTGGYNGFIVAIFCYFNNPPLITIVSNQGNCGFNITSQSPLTNYGVQISVNNTGIFRYTVTQIG